MKLKKGDRIKRRDAAQTYIVSRVGENKQGQAQVRLVTHDSNLLTLAQWHPVERLARDGYRKLANPANLTRLRKRKRVRLEKEREENA